MVVLDHLVATMSLMGMRRPLFKLLYTETGITFDSTPNIKTNNGLMSIPDNQHLSFKANKQVGGTVFECEAFSCVSDACCCV